ncbi:MAG: hypothetical protein P8X85_00445 [Desulfobacterales bacterium]
MGSLPIIEKSLKRRACLKNKNLPANYMADYTVLGLVVDRLEAALRILQEKNFAIHKDTDGYHISIEGAARIHEAADLLGQNGIDCAVADIVDQVYQG